MLLGTCYDLEIEVNVTHAMSKTSKREWNCKPMYTLLKGEEYAFLGKSAVIK